MNEFCQRSAHCISCIRVLRPAKQKPFHCFLYVFSCYANTLTVRESNQISLECLVQEPNISTTGKFDSQGYTVYRKTNVLLNSLL